MLKMNRNVRLESENGLISFASNPIEENSTELKKLSDLIYKIINDEFPFFKNKDMLCNLVLYSLVQKVNTIQTMENVLSYIKEAKIKQINDISFKNGDINIKCSI